MNSKFYLISEIINKEGFYIDSSFQKNEPKTFKSINQKYKNRRIEQLKKINDYEEKIRNI